VKKPDLLFYFLGSAYMFLTQGRKRPTLLFYCSGA